MTSKAALVLVCKACATEAKGTALNGRAFHGREDDDARNIVVLCPKCAEEVDDA